jgi:segregation and condensation protein A
MTAHSIGDAGAPDTPFETEAALEILPPRLDAQGDEALIIDVDGFEGPLDLLLTLSRSQKVDLMRISVLQLAEQYLVFVERARALRLELAADYLVMAAWLAYLKSRLLLPPDPGEDGPSAQDLAAHLAYQLERLSAMREAAAKLMARDQKGRDFFVRGAPETVARRAHVRYEANLLDLMRAYARIKTRDEFRPYAFDRVDVFTMEAALDRLRGMIGYGGDWADLTSYLPKGWNVSPTRRRAALAAHFAAALEMAKQGQISLRQTDVFGPIHMRAKETP